MLDMMVFITATLSGLICGWWLRGADADLRQRRDADGTKTMMQKLQQLAEGVAQNVGQHSTRMKEIHDQLVEGRNQDPEVVVKAVSNLLDFNDSMQRALSSAEEKLKQQAQQIQSHATEARTDALTQLANRRAFDLAMQECCLAFQEESLPTTVMILDVDHFKKFNDTYGHQAGDEVLRGVARVLRRHIPQQYLVARYGGEEFAVVFTQCTYAQVRKMSETARAAIGQATFGFQGQSLHVTSSAGLSQFLEQESTEVLIRRADEALYASKEAGRDCGRFHDGTQFLRLEVPTSSEPKPDKDLLRSEPVVDLERTDFSAGVSQQRVFEADLERRLAERRRAGITLCVLMACVDEYREICQRYGADAGEALTRAAVLFIKATMREMDHVADCGDGTFSLMLPGTTLAGAVRVAERLRSAISRCTVPKRKFPAERFTISVGVAEATSEEEAERLLNRVREALNAASQQGRNCSYVHNGENLQLVGAGHISMCMA